MIMMLHFFQIGKMASNFLTVKVYKRNFGKFVYLIIEEKNMLN
jgi:hypothetical protein